MEKLEEKTKSLDKCLKIIQREKSNLRKKFGVKDIAIFGSFARNEIGEESDIDIMVELEKQNKTFDNFMELKFYLNSLFPNKKIDLVLKDAIREEIKSQIFRDAVHA